MKQLKREETALKVKTIHDELVKQKDDLVLPRIPNADEMLLIQRWQEGSRSADFAIEEDRREAFQLLKKLHRTKETINWSGRDFLPYHSQFLKWQMRMMKFKSRVEELKQFLSYKDITAIIQYGERALQQIEYERIDDSKQLTLLHGDVVHHNFLWCSDNQLRLIDFDLAHLGDADDEYILWLHRVLPTIDYNLNGLFEELPELHEIEKEKLHRLKFPNELLREWLYILDLPLGQQLIFLDYLYPYTERALTYWGKLWYDSERLARA
ncbi:MAG: phosphotransferase [Lysinibacillus sp.]